MEQKKLERKGCGDGKGGDEEEEEHLQCVWGDVNSLVENYCVKEIVVTRQNYAEIQLGVCWFCYAIPFSMNRFSYPRIVIARILQFIMKAYFSFPRIFLW